MFIRTIDEDGTSRLLQRARQELGPWLVGVGARPRVKAPLVPTWRAIVIGLVVAAAVLAWDAARQGDARARYAASEVQP